MRCSPWIVTLACLVAPGLANADRPLDVMHPMRLAPGSVPNVVNSHVLFLNRCAAGCVVKTGATDSRTSTSDIGHGTLSAFSAGDTVWNSVKACMVTMMSRFNVTVTDVDPGPLVDHFEVMIAGSPTQLGLSNGVGGIADYPCQSPGQCGATYIPNALVFDFAEVWQGDVTYLCGTAAQEIAHAWTLDHATSSSDPMTYNQYGAPLSYRDGAPCGSDCMYSCPSGTGSCNAFGVTCSGSGLSGTHTCMGSGLATQDEVKIITALFGPAGAKPPTVTITSPANGSAQQAGFKVTATCTSSDSTVIEVDLAVDNVPTATLTVSPYTFDTLATLKDGSHHLAVTCATAFQATATATADIIIGQKCSKDSDCTMANYICYEGACVAGPNAAGGLGATCANNAACSSGSCASDGSQMLCVVPCDPSHDMCPSGFGCLMAGANGVCWLGANNSSGGCCNTAGDSGAPGSIALGLGFAALLFGRRKRS